MNIDRARCTITAKILENSEFKKYKDSADVHRNYGILWPEKVLEIDTSWDVDVPIIEEIELAAYLNVERVWIRYEGANKTGSMKDYPVRAAVSDGEKNNTLNYSVVSSGNHAAALAHFTKEVNRKCVVFVPATTSKLPILSSFENVQIVAVKDAIFEDVYRLAQKVELPNTYNANVSNDFLMTRFSSASKQIIDTLGHDFPTHVIAGVGNGTYLAGLIFGFDYFGRNGIKAVPVGMRGAFPTEEAFIKELSYWEYEDFLYGEDDISSAEGSIACASYSMPQLIYAMRKSKGFPLGGIVNQDISDAYDFLYEKTQSFALGYIPEPTGIMSLAAVIKHRHIFEREDKLLLSFTGAGYKDLDGIKKFGGRHKTHILEKINQRPLDLVLQGVSDSRRILFVEKNTEPEFISELLAK